MLHVARSNGLTAEWKFTKHLQQIFKIFCNFMMLLQGNYSWKKGTL